ncbi:TetR/AcrR family transcriptional regulator [Photobacterium alginatilyticum]|uniref:TetR/AcrR family transcriptional regulator n=1 Tax=Photobacterium alginatilyticum TaxID=1775171 RepID=A0ABW9YGL8_9GAMM|nr:TetR/AcrR family transcriptional regulator [Photobacterium alginatilyticum]NBI52431.1 TetR/AcrR family transcriptional regulator [Photobacterium alginatilyticum]
MGKIEQNKEIKRRAILAAAQEIFLSEGYVLSSMDKIAAQARMTKQTVYRYFPTKIDLFQATLRHMGESLDDSFLTHLKNPNTRDALTGFARDFIGFHLSDNHIATFRLLVAESAKAPEIVSIFHAVGPDDTHEKLAAFFSERLDVKDTETTIKLWLGMLLSLRSGVLMGREKPSQHQIDEHARKATDFLLAAIV